MIWNAIFYLVKTGCQWYMLPKEFPKWESAYLLMRVLKELCSSVKVILLLKKT